MTAFLFILGLLLGLLIPRDIAPLRRVSAWLMRNHDNERLAWATFAAAAAAFLLAVLLSGCARFPKPQAGGGASASLGGVAAAPTVATISQPENPAAVSTQSVSRDESKQVVASVPVVRVTETPQPDGTVIRVTEQLAPQVLTSTVREQTATHLGAAHKDEGREIAAKLASFQAVQYVGMVVLLLGAVGFAHPALRALVGGKDTALVVGLVGAGMVAGPFLLVEYANWFFLLIVLAGGYWFLSRMKYQHGQLDALREKE